MIGLGLVLSTNDHRQTYGRDVTYWAGVVWWLTLDALLECRHDVGAKL
jgi:hypothetical protein